MDGPLLWHEYLNVFETSSPWHGDCKIWKKIFDYLNFILFTIKIAIIKTGMPNRVEQGACREILRWRQGYPAIITVFLVTWGNPVEIAGSPWFYHRISLHALCSTLFDLQWRTVTNLNPWDHPFKTSAFFRGRGQKLPKFADGYLVVKNCRREEGRGQKSWKFADVLNGWSHLFL